MKQRQKDNRLIGQWVKRIKGQQPFHLFTSSPLILLSFLPIFLSAQTVDFHIVIKGDTLWHISGNYLGNPFRWKEIWNLNKEMIPNPDLIFPAQKLRLSEVQAEKSEPPPSLGDLMPLPKEEVIAEEVTATTPTVMVEEPPPEMPPVTLLAPLPGLAIATKKESESILSNVRNERALKSESQKLGRILRNPNKILFEKGDELTIRFYKAGNFSPGTLLLVVRWKETLLTPEGEVALGSETKYLDLIGAVELTQNLTPTKSIAKVIEISDYLEAGDLLAEFPQ